MKWFKHLTGSHDDPIIRAAELIWRDAAYVIFFKTCEIYGEEYKDVDEDEWLTLNYRLFLQKLHKSSTKVEQVLNFYQQKCKIYYTIEHGEIKIKIPKFNNLASNWTTRKSARPTEVPTEAPTAPRSRSRSKDKTKTKDSPNLEKFEIFWNDYHTITKIKRTDKVPAEKHWKKLSSQDQLNAIENIQEYYNSISNKNYVHKARTYLSDKHFNDEFGDASNTPDGNSDRQIVEFEDFNTFDESRSSLKTPVAPVFMRT